MWDAIMDRLPSGMELFCTFLAFLIPFLVYKIKQKMHQDMDPPWKNSRESESE